jgi:hypothetical protein
MSIWRLSTADSPCLCDAACVAEADEATAPIKPRADAVFNGWVGRRGIFGIAVEIA